LSYHSPYTHYSTASSVFHRLGVHAQKGFWGLRGVGGLGGPLFPVLLEPVRNKEAMQAFKVRTVFGTSSSRSQGLVEKYNGRVKKLLPRAQASQTRVPYSVSWDARLHVLSGI
jgi:hypothetical protein